MKPLTHHPASQIEAQNAVDWYWAQSRLASLDFTDKLDIPFERLSANPQACAPYLHGTRRILLDCFPFSIVFRERLHDIQIIVIAHAKRRPGYWAKRVQQ